RSKAIPRPTSAENELATQGGARMSARPKPPATYREFIALFPELGRAWELAGEAGRAGPLDEQPARPASPASSQARPSSGKSAMNSRYVAGGFGLALIRAPPCVASSFSADVGRGMAFER